MREQTLIEKIHETIYNAISNKEQKPYRNLYRTKILDPQTGENIHISFRFFTENKKYYIFSLLINLSSEKDNLRYSIHALDQRRIFSTQVDSFEETLDEEIFSSSEIIGKKATLTPSMKKEEIALNKNYMNYLRINKVLPRKALWVLYTKYMYNNIHDSIKLLEEI